MRYQLRLIGEDLFALHDQLSKRCWAVLVTLLPEAGRWGAYRSLRRRLRVVLSRHVEARQYCGQSVHCDSFLHAVDPGEGYRKSVSQGEAAHTNRYLLNSMSTVGQLVGELSREGLAILAAARPGNLIKGAGRRVRRAVREVLRNNVYRNPSCGETQLCGVSEPVDPWVRRSARGPVQFVGDV